jgi:predicted histidine transporter YuiF (NhaC family)
MIPVSPYVAVIVFFGYAIVGMAIGALTGWLVSLTTKCGPRGVWKDSFLGSFGFLAGILGAIYMPWPRNTVYEKLDSGGMMASTMNRYQHPERVAILMAVVLPLLHELCRFKRVRAKKPISDVASASTH